MNLKLAGVGLLAVLAILVGTTLSGMVLALTLVGSVPEPMKISIPTAQLTNLELYGGAYNYNNSTAAVLVIEATRLSAPNGLTITKNISALGMGLQGVIEMSRANIYTLLLKAEDINSESGNLGVNDTTNSTLEVSDDNVTEVSEAFTKPIGVNLFSNTNTFNNLIVNAYLVSFDRLDFQGLRVYIKQM